MAHRDRQAGRGCTIGSPGSHWPPGSGCSRGGPRHSRTRSLGKVRQHTEAPPFCRIPYPACLATPKLTMKSTGIVQPLALTPGDVDGHWELPLGHRGVELWVEGGSSLGQLRITLTLVFSRTLLPEWVPLFGAHISPQTASLGQRLWAPCSCCTEQAS